MRRTLIILTVGAVGLALAFTALGGSPTGFFAGQSTEVASLVKPHEKPHSMMRGQVRGSDLRDGFRGDNGLWCEYKRVKVFDQFHGETFYTDEKVCL